MDNSIEIKDLSFEYRKGENTIDNISFNVEKGSYVAILGHNGSGKSTIAKLIIGLLEKASGSIRVNGKELNENTFYEIRKDIGIVFQNPDNQFIGATVKDDIAFGLENICVPQVEMDDIINEYASRVKMQNFLNHEPTKLSGGQKQRVAIAGILAMHPSIIILDEATSMLDPLGKKEINDLVKELKKDNNMTVVSITHDIEEARYADKIIVLNEGKIITQGTPNEVLFDEELLHKVELDIPFALKLSKSLTKHGVSKTIQVEELEEQLCQLHSKM